MSMDVWDVDVLAYFRRETLCLTNSMLRFLPFCSEYSTIPEVSTSFSGMERNTLSREAALYSGNERNVWRHVCDCARTSSAGSLESDFLIAERRERFAVVSAGVMIAVSSRSMAAAGKKKGRGTSRFLTAVIETGDFLGGGLPTVAY
jgi:hypothetical protein